MKPVENVVEPSKTKEDSQNQSDNKSIPDDLSICQPDEDNEELVAAHSTPNAATDPPIQQCPNNSPLSRCWNRLSLADWLSENQRIKLNCTAPQLQQCCHDFVMNLQSQLRFNVFIEAFCGAVFCLAMTVSMHCWIKHQTTLTSVSLILMSILAMCLLNSVNSSVALNNPAQKQKAMILLYICYIIMSLQIGWCIWKDTIDKKQEEDYDWQPSTQNSTDLYNLIESTQMCYDSEMFTGIVIFFVATIMRFANAMFSNLWTPSAVTESWLKQCSVYKLSAIMIACAVMFITGVFLQFYCMLYDTGTYHIEKQKYHNKEPPSQSHCQIVPLAYIAPLPFCLFAAHLSTFSQNSIWRSWYTFFCAFLYTNVMVWPFVLYDLDLITDNQRNVALASSWCLVISTRMSSYVIVQGLVGTNHSGFSAPRQRQAAGPDEFYFY